MKLLTPITAPITDAPLPLSKLGNVNPGVATEPVKLDPEDFAKENLIEDPDTGKTFINDYDKHITEFDTKKIKSLMTDKRNELVALNVELENIKSTIEKKVKASKTQKAKGNTKDVNLMAAIRRVYGIKTDTITFDMYKQALALRARFHREETEAAAKDSPFKLGEPLCGK